MTEQPLIFKVPKRDVVAVPFVLEGQSKIYKFTPPKQAEMVLPMINAENDLAAAKAAFEWLDKGLSKADQEHISKRLTNPKDDLDIDTVQEVVTGLVEHLGTRPTT